VDVAFDIRKVAVVKRFLTGLYPVELLWIGTAGSPGTGEPAREEEPGMRQALLHPLTPLIGLSLAATALLCAYVLFAVTPSPLVEPLTTRGWALLAVFWMDADARRRRSLPCYDFGLLAAVAFPLSLLWYCLWSRRVKGVALLLVLLALLYGPWVIAAWLWAMVWAAR
jgi:hypothetical protein